ncbi:MAG: hypothetical protein ACREQ2_22650 [Candidatus Binatia bacterium]
MSVMKKGPPLSQEVGIAPTNTAARSMCSNRFTDLKLMPVQTVQSLRSVQAVKDYSAKVQKFKERLTEVTWTFLKFSKRQMVGEKRRLMSQFENVDIFYAVHLLSLRKYDRETRTRPSRPRPVQSDLYPSKL